MRLSVVLLVLAGLGVLGGAWLIGMAAFGAAIIFDSLCLGVFAWFRDDGAKPQQEVSNPVADILERARAS